MLRAEDREIVCLRRKSIKDETQRHCGKMKELRVEMSPSAVVTEGQRLTLTCRTSCPLTHTTNNIWYFNSRPLTPRENQNKHLILDPVSRENAGSYSCAVETNKDISSAPKTLTVQSITGTWTPAAAGGSAALLVLMPLTVFCWIRKKRTSSESPTTEMFDQTDQLSPGHVDEDISAQPKEEDEVHYSSIYFKNNHVVPLYSSVQSHQPREQEHSHYAAVSFSSDGASAVTPTDTDLQTYSAIKL